MEIVFTTIIKWNMRSLKEVSKDFKNSQQQEIE